MEAPWKQEGTQACGELRKWSAPEHFRRYASSSPSSSSSLVKNHTSGRTTFQGAGQTHWKLIAAVSVALAMVPIGLTSPSGVSRAFAKSEHANAKSRSGNDDSPGNSGHSKKAKKSKDKDRDDDDDDVNKRADVRDRDRANRDAEIRNRDRARADARRNGSNELGNLNAAHASANARARASSNSSVGHISSYETRMHNALAIQDPVARNAAITAARGQLAQSANKPLTPSAIARVDSLLGIQGASPQLGAVR